MSDDFLPRLVGVNHVALEVGDVEAAVAFYATVFSFALRGRGPGMAFLDMGDQFLALSEGRSQAPDDHRHFGLVVDDLDRARRALGAAGVEILPGRGVDFRDPWGNRIQLVGYADIQFTRARPVALALGIEDIRKTEDARRELEERGLTTRRTVPDFESLGEDELEDLLRRLVEEETEISVERRVLHRQIDGLRAELASRLQR